MLAAITVPSAGVVGDDASPENESPLVERLLYLVRKIWHAVDNLSDTLRSASWTVVWSICHQMNLSGMTLPARSKQSATFSSRR